MKRLRVAMSPITGTIFCGTLLKSGVEWSANKQDVTMDALCAVADHVIRFGEPVIISDGDGKELFKITVEKLS